MNANANKSGKKQKGRTQALRVLERVFNDNAFADEVLSSALVDTIEADRAFATELVYGVLRNFIKIDFIIGRFSRVATARMELKVLNALRIGIYQLYFMDRIPVSACVNESVELVKGLNKGAPGFVNAVLRKAASQKDSIIYPDIKTDPAAHISVVHSHPIWLVKRWIVRFGVEGALEACRVDNLRPDKILRVNTLVNSRSELMESLKGKGAGVDEARYSKDALVYLDGEKLDANDNRFYIQDEASQLIALLVSPQKGEVILDACAAPGGKCTHMAQLMENTGRIDALELHAGRVRRIIDLCERLGVTNVIAKRADASSSLAFAPSRGYDAVLLDAPCTGLGVLRRTPDIKLRLTESDISALSQRQADLLENLSGYVGKGGRLVYSVCTTEPEETVDIVSKFLDRHKDFIVENAKDILIASCAELAGHDGFLRTYPHLHNMDGFFGASLKRIG